MAMKSAFSWRRIKNERTQNTDLQNSPNDLVTPKVLGLFFFFFAGLKRVFTTILHVVKINVDLTSK